jgi:DNA-binding CsgD family transcriptional regulator
METSAFAYLLITNVSSGQWNSPVWDYPQVIGRHRDCEILIPVTYSTVSRQHALIGTNEDGLWIQDLGSMGGTCLNGVPLTANRLTQALIGDRISLAGLELYLVSPKAAILQEGAISQNSQSTVDGIKIRGRRSIESLHDVRLQCLSQAELEIVRWLCRGLTTADEIGRTLFRSSNTVRTQINKIYQKLGVHSREDLLSWMRKCEIAWTQTDLDADLLEDLSSNDSLSSNG